MNGSHNVYPPIVLRILLMVATAVRGAPLPSLARRNIPRKFFLAWNKDRILIHLPRIYTYTSTYVTTIVTTNPQGRPTTVSGTTRRTTAATISTTVLQTIPPNPSSSGVAQLWEQW